MKVMRQNNDVIWEKIDAEEYKKHIKENNF